MTYIEKKYMEFYEKHGYIPKMFNPYNCVEVQNVAKTLTAECGSTTSSATVLIIEGVKDEDIITF